MSIATRDRIISELVEHAKNAARRNKPTMWAYYLRIARRLRDELDADSDGGVAGQALAVSQMAEERCKKLPASEAADLWSLGIYCRRILRAWCPGVPYRVSLEWMRQRDVEAELKGGAT